MAASVVGLTATFAAELVVACGVGWVAASAVAWAGAPVSATKMSAVVGHAAGLPLAKLEAL